MCRTTGGIIWMKRETTLSLNVRSLYKAGGEGVQGMEDKRVSPCDDGPCDGSVCQTIRCYEEETRRREKPEK